MSPCGELLWHLNICSCACLGHLVLRGTFFPSVSLIFCVLLAPVCTPLTGASASPAGISGKGPGAAGNADAPGSPAGAFARMSDSIPPLPPPQQPPGEEDEDDWES